MENVAIIGRSKFQTLCCEIQKISTKSIDGALSILQIAYVYRNYKITETIPNVINLCMGYILRGLNVLVSLFSSQKFLVEMLPFRTITFSLGS